MKLCPRCKRNYSDDTLLFCLDDGSQLVNPQAQAETVRIHTARATAIPATDVLPQPGLPSPPRQSKWIIYVLASAVLFTLIAGAVVIGWLVLNKQDKTTGISTASPTPDIRKSGGDDSSPKNPKDDSPSWKLVGTWQAVVEELGSRTTISYTFNANGTSEATFTERGGQKSTNHGSWRYSDGVLYEKFESGASGRGSIDWKSDDTFEITIIDNGIPAYTGVKRLYHRVS